jgi:hypothetical protein
MPGRLAGRNDNANIVHKADDESVDGYFRHFALADSKAWGKHDRDGRIVGGIRLRLLGMGVKKAPQ